MVVISIPLTSVDSEIQIILMSQRTIKCIAIESIIIAVLVVIDSIQVVFQTSNTYYVVCGGSDAYSSAVARDLGFGNWGCTIRSGLRMKQQEDKSESSIENDRMLGTRVCYSNQGGWTGHLW